jgi:hypothetical protein
MWSFQKPGQAPLVFPVEGQGCSRWNSRVTARDRYSRAESGPELANEIASAIISPGLSVTGALMPYDPNEQGREDGGAEDDPESAAFAKSPRVGCLASWLAMNSRLLSFRAKSVLV